MGELGRIFTNKKTIGFLVCIILLNSFFFVWEQRKTMGDRSTFYGIKKAYETLLSMYEGKDLEAIHEDMKGQIILAQVIDDLKEIDRYKREGNSGFYGLKEIYDLLLWQYEQDYPDIIEKYNANKPFYTSKEVTYRIRAVQKANAQLEYMRKEYPNKLEKIKEQAENMKEISIFSKENTFSKRNIEKTEKNYQEMRGASLTLGNDEGITAWIHFSMTDYFMLGSMVFIILQFLEERKKGLWNIIYAMQRGRLGLQIRRAGVVMLVSFFGSFILYGSNLVISTMVYGSVDYGRIMQSNPVFQNYPLPFTTGELIFQYMAIKGLTFALLGMAIWLAISAVYHINFSILTMGIVLAAEYIANRTIPIQSKWNVLKYINLFFFLDIKTQTTSYLNINLMGYPIGIQEATLFAVPLFLTIIIILTCVVNVKKKPIGGIGIIRKHVNRWIAVLSKKSGHVSIFRFEGYKLLWVQKGVFLLLALGYLAYQNLNDTHIFYSPELGILNDYYKRLEGPVTKNTHNFIKEEQAQIDTMLVALAESTKLYQEGKIGEGDYYPISEQMKSIQNRLNALETLTQRVSEIEQIKRQKNIKPWLVNSIGYDFMLGEGAISQHRRDGLLVILLITLLMGGAIAYEKQTGALPLVRSTTKGREKVTKMKILWAGILSFCVLLPIGYVELRNMNRNFGLSALDAPVQSLEFLEGFPFLFSIKGFLILVYLCRGIVLCSIAILVLLISSYTKTTSEGLIASVAVTTLPAALLYIGFKQFAYVSFLKVVGIMEIWINTEYSGFLWILPIVVVMVIGVASLIYLRRRPVA